MQSRARDRLESELGRGRWWRGRFMGRGGGVPSHVLGSTQVDHPVAQTASKVKRQGEELFHEVVAQIGCLSVCHCAFGLWLLSRLALDAVVSSPVSVDDVGGESPIVPNTLCVGAPERLGNRRLDIAEAAHATRRVRHRCLYGG
eukprot:3124582-Pleurochrysis_carterae.AAC.1